MGTPRGLLPLLALAGVMLCGCDEKRTPSTPQASPPPGAGAPSDSGLSAAPPPDSAQSAAAAAEASTSSTDLMDVTWEWVRFTTPVEQMDIDAPERYTVRFGRDGHLALRADCNRGTGAYTMSPDRQLTLKPIALTRAMCAKGSLSDRFAKEVGRATSFFMKDGDLFLELPVDSGTLRLRRQP